jgi:rfaE bifunctional protein kinase chain/domain
MRKGLLQEILNEIKKVSIAIVGDFCLDGYWFIDESGSEISVETGLPTRPVRSQRYSPGGASNVANNLVSLEVKEVNTFGVIGNDPFGIELVNIFRRAGIITDNLIVQDSDWSTHVFIKPYCNEQEKERIDFGNFNILHNDTADELIQKLTEAIEKVELVIINQQVYSGIHTEYFRQKLVGVIGSYPDKIFIADSRSYNDSYNGAYRKMNDNEALRLCGLKGKAGDSIPDPTIRIAAETMFNRYGKPVFITRGKLGSLVIDKNGVIDVPGLLLLSKLDTVGAGDSYLAGAAAALAAGYSADIAAELGSFTAGVTVQKLFQTGTASPNEILELGSDPDLIYNPVIADDIRHAIYVNNTGIEIINKIEEPAAIRYGIFDNDGTISTMREGWDKIMAPMMVRIILGEMFRYADESILANVTSRVEEFIDKTTGIQTLMQMKFLPELIKEFGYVPEDKILDEHGYKEMYNIELMKLVRDREKKLLNGELQIEDLTIKNAIPFIQKLYNSGIKLYLTSGTDVGDARHEASVLGYDHLFEGGIYGAVGDVTKEAKKMVINSILDQAGKSEAGMIVTFGDGPVEIRETHKRGGISVGIASDEQKRSGLNKTKRTRLIKAGADIVIPDFSESEELLEILNIR